MNRKNASYFHDKWLKDEKFSRWVRKARLKTNARWSICEKDIDLSSMRVGALISHGAGKRHKGKSDKFKIPGTESVFVHKILKSIHSSSSSSGISSSFGTLRTLESCVIPESVI